jgi:transcriptional regulator with GAF, ATPase, and Fis domain/CheY-like chemotaxis protein
MSNRDNTKLVSIFEGITSKLVESKEPNRLYDVAVQIAMETMDAQACSLYLEHSVIDPATEPDNIVMVSGAGFEKYRIGVKYQRGKGLTGKIWQTSKSVKLDTQQQIEDPERGWEGLHNQIVQDKVSGWVSYSLIGVPLRIGMRTIGVLKVENKNPNEPSCFSQEDQLMLETIASTIALAIENQRYSEQTYSLILNALTDVSKMLVSPEIITFQMLCDRIVEKCIDVFNAEACSLYIQDVRKPADAESEFIVMVSGAGYERYRKGARYRRGEGLTGSIWANSQPVKYDNRNEVENKSQGWKGVYNNQVRNKMINWECSSLIGVPLRIGDKTIGVLKVENKKPVKLSHFTHNDLRGLEVLASNIALALEMRRQQQVLFKKGEAARLFTHGLGNNVQTALHAVKNAIDEVRAFDRSISGAMPYLDLAERTLNEIDNLRERVLNDSRSTQRKTTISVNQLLQHVVDRCGVFKREGIALHHKFLRTDLFTSIDLEEVLQGFDMLIENSIDAVKGKPTPGVWITANHHHDPKKTLDMARVFFVDNGPGFTKQQRSEFEEKYDISSTKHAGLGMGVNVAFRHFGDNGFSLRIVDPPSEMTPAGAAFQIDIPLHEPRHLTVLAIDDDDNYLSLLTLKVKSIPSITLRTNNTYELLLEAISEKDVALKALNEFDLILLDCDFEKAPLDGLQILNRLQDMNSTLAAKVVLMSGVRGYYAKTDVAILHKYKEILDKPEGLHDLWKRKG